LAEVALKVGIALRLKTGLVGTAAARRALAVFGVELVHHVHAGDDPAERREALTVERGVVAEVDEHLAGAGVRPGHRIGDKAAPVALFHRVSLDTRLPPRRRYLRIAADAELHHEARDHAKEAAVVGEAVLDEIVEAVGAVRRPVAVYFDDEH